jgi:hypothetical protein
MVSVATGRYTPGGGGPGGQGISAGGGTIDARDRAIHLALAGVGLSGPVMAVAAATPVIVGVGLSALPGIDAGILWYLRRKQAGQLVQTGIALGSGPTLGYNLWRYGPGIVTWLLQQTKSSGGSSQSSQQNGTPGGTASGFGRNPSARKRSIRRAKASRRGDRSAPWCYRHKKRHWCRYTR